MLNTYTEQGKNGLDLEVGGEKKKTKTLESTRSASSLPCGLVVISKSSH